MYKVYVGSSLHNAAQVREVYGLLKQHDIHITYDWTTHGQVHTEEELRRYGIEECRGVYDCDVFLMLHPARLGTHVELGIALALNKKVVMVCAADVEQKTFYYLPNVERHSNVDEAVASVIRMCS